MMGREIAVKLPDIFMNTTMHGIYIQILCIFVFLCDLCVLCGRKIALLVLIECRRLADAQISGGDPCNP